MILLAFLLMVLKFDTSINGKYFDLANEFQNSFNKHYKDTGGTDMMFYPDNWSGFKAEFSGAKRVYEEALNAKSSDPGMLLLKRTKAKTTDYQIIRPQESAPYLGGN